MRVGDEPGLVGLMTGTIRYNGEMAHYSFQGKKGEELYIDPVQGDHFATVRQPSDEQVNTLSSLPVDGNYRVDVGGNRTGDYAVRLLSLQQSPTLPLNTRVAEQAPAGQDFIYRVSLVRHQRLRIEDHVPSSSRSWYARSIDESLNQRPNLSLHAGREPGVFEGTASADGEYVIFAASRSNNDVTFVPFSFTATVTNPAPVVKAGMGIVRTGTVQRCSGYQWALQHHVLIANA